MASPAYVRSPLNIMKRLRIANPRVAQTRLQSNTTSVARQVEDGMRTQEVIEQDIIELADAHQLPLPHGLQSPRRNVDGQVQDPHDMAKMAPQIEQPRLPRSVQALYLSPLRRMPTHGIPVCNLQLRSYSVRNVEFMADFALRAAYYLNLPAKGPVPLPRITERWTVPRSNFIHKKSQENWERITLRRLIQIQDADPEVVRRWLAFVRKWSWYGVGMKANVWEWESLDVAKNMDSNEAALKEGIEGVNWELFGRRKVKGSQKLEDVAELLDKQGFSTPIPQR